MRNMLRVGQAWPGRVASARTAGISGTAPRPIACYNRRVRPPGGMVDAADLKSEAERRGGSNPPAGIK